MLNRRNVVFSIVCVLGVIFDQITKWWVIENIELYRGEIVVIPNFLSLVHAQNPGAAMGLLQEFEYRQALFAVFTIIAIYVIIQMFRELPTTDWFLSSTLGMIMSGAIGNGLDRLRFRYVTDFIRVYTENESLKTWLIETVGTNEWPSFNIADSALVVGVLLFLVHFLFLEENEEEDGESGNDTKQTSGSANSA